MSIYPIIKELESNNSRIFKEEVLKREKDNETLKKVFYLSCNNMIRFHVKKIPHYTSALVDESQPLDWALGCLSDLTNRVVTGNDAITFLRSLLQSVVEDDGKVIERIIGKDMKCGVDASTANKIWPGLIPEIPYMRCSLLKDMKSMPWERGVYSQLKADGSYANIDFEEDGDIKIYTRNGRHYNPDMFENLVWAIRSDFEPGHQIHGELLVKEDGKILPRQIGNGILNSVNKGGSFGLNQEPYFEIWDMVPLDFVEPGGYYNAPYSERYNSLKEQITPNNEHMALIETRIVYSMEEAYAHYFELIAQGYEGTIIKHPDAIWEDRTSRHQFKVKVTFQVDLKIVGFRPGNGKNAKTFGALICESSDGKLSVGASGMSDKEREAIWVDKDNVLGKIVTIESNNIMYGENGKQNSLFLPVFVEIREDKTEADSMERIEEQLADVLNTLKAGKK